MIVMETIEQLKKIELENSTPDDVRKILYESPLPAIKSVITKGTYIIRARKGDGYTKRSQMTYCPVEFCKSLQRATLNGQTMFYGVISDDQSYLENARAISCAECSKLTRAGLESIGREKFTLSYWEVVKPISVVSFITDSTFPKVQNNKLLSDLRNTFNNMSLTSQEKNLIRFISDEFSKIVTDNREYLITATISSDIINKTKTDGIIFPSVQLGGQGGLNIALSPNAVNSKLRFIRTLGQTLYKNKDKSLIRIEKYTEKNSKTHIKYQFSNQILLDELNIKDVNELPLIE